MKTVMNINKYTSFMFNKILLVGMMITFMFGCGPSNTNTSNISLPPNVHRGVAIEKINTSKYTYLLVNEKGVENWLAFPLAEVKIGEPYYYSDPMEMSQFESKELGRVFEKVLFVNGVSLEPIVQTQENPHANMNPQPMEAPPMQNVEAPMPSNEPGALVHKIKVIEKINTTKYTYVLGEEKGEQVWLAFPLAEVKVGNNYYYDNEMLMEHFESKELNRVFDRVYFIQALYANAPNSNNGGKETTASTNPHQTVSGNATPAITEKIEPVSDGISIATLMANKAKYANQKVKVKGKVTKYNPEIMGQNWVHIQDGTNYKNTFDLTITTLEVVKVGETYIFEGKVILDKDFGAGYKYEVLLEGATLKR